MWSPITSVKWSEAGLTHSTPPSHRTTCQAMSESCMCHKCHKLLQNCPNLSQWHLEQHSLNRCGSYFSHFGLHMFVCNRQHTGLAQVRYPQTQRIEMAQKKMRWPRKWPNGPNGPARAKMVNWANGPSRPNGPMGSNGMDLVQSYISSNAKHYLWCWWFIGISLVRYRRWNESLWCFTTCLTASRLAAD